MRALIPVAAGWLRRCSGRNAHRLALGLLGLVLGAVATPGLAAGAGAGTIEWLEPEFPPAYIHAGEMKDQGYLDQTLADLIALHLSDYRHHRVRAKPARLFRELRTKTNTCALGLAQTPERARQYLYSQPLFRYLPIGLIVAESDVPALSGLIADDGAIALHDVLVHTDWLLGTVDQRHMPDALRPFLQEQAQRFHPVSAGSATTNLLSMLERKREFTGVMAYSFELQFFTQYRAINRSQHYRWLALKETPRIEEAFLACARSEQGQDVVDAVNGFISNAANRQKIQSYYDNWLDPAGRARMAQIAPAKR